MTDKLQQIEEAVRDYHHALDLRQHGSNAAWAALQRIETILDIPWQQGQEEKRRREGEKKPKDEDA